MDRFKKLKKEKSGRSSKDKQPLFITDVKSFKENIKIKEILRTVKMNSSMRLKAPPGSKVMNNKDFNDDNCFDETSGAQNSTEILSATNPDVVFSSDEQNEIDIDTNLKESTQQSNNGNEIHVVELSSVCNNLSVEPSNIEQSTGSSQSNEGSSKTEIVKNNNNKPTVKTNDNTRDRKLSLDPAILSRREGLSQSELDLHSIGKSPLERKSSFFRKTMDSFVKNTTEMFKKQNKSLQRHVSMSVPLQSLSDKSLTSNNYREVPIQQVKDGSENNRLDVQTPTQIARSNSSLSSLVQGQSSEQSLVDSYAGSQPTLHPSSGSTMEDLHSSSAHSLNEAYLKEAMLNSRAISMGSGLDSPFGHPRRKSSRFNRVSWLASEGYLRRLTQDERTQEMQSCQSYQDFSCIPENEHYNRKSDTKGRRLSYQRAVSGEDPVVPTRYQDSTMKRKNQIPEMRSETHVELANYLAEFSRHGIPDLRGFDLAPIPDEAFVYILWASNQSNVDTYIDIESLPEEERGRQAVIRELISSEAQHIKHLLFVLEVFIGTAHSLQSRKKLLNIDTEKLFSKIPDVLNASLQFWNIILMPMIKDAVENSRPFDTELMYTGFSNIDEILFPYEKHIVEQTKLLDYYRSKRNDPEFSLYITWCHSRKECKRLQLSDFISKPMQRLTKYTLLFRRLVENTEVGPKLSALMIMEMLVKFYVQNVNNSVRQREEIEKLIKLQATIEPYYYDLKNEDLEHQFRLCSRFNLRIPMLYCRPSYSRCLIHQANLRFRDGAKETDVRVFLLTDMILICQRLYKCPRNYKLLRPIYMIDKLVQAGTIVGRNNELTGFGYIVLDDTGCSSHSFILSISPKEPAPKKTLRSWENKFLEAKLTYEMMIWSTQNPGKEMSKAELEQMMDYLQIRVSSSVDPTNIEHQARKRVNAMVYESKAIPNLDASPFAAEIGPKVIVGISARPPGSPERSHMVHRTVPMNAPMSLHKPLSVSVHSDEETPSPSTSRLHRRTISMEPLIPPLHSDEAGPSINVQLSGGNVGTVLAEQQLMPTRPSQQLLRMDENSQNNVASFINTLPDLTVEPCTPKSNSSPSQTSASQKLYQCHQEELQRHQLEASQKQQYLSPDHRGSCHPPRSPTRGSLKRGLAFSSSFITTPTLTKMEHVGSQSPIQLDDAPSTSQQPQSADRGSSPKPGPSSEKSDKKPSSIASDYQRDPSEDRQSEPCSSRTVSPRRSRKDDPCRYESISASSSYKEESPTTSFRDESTDLSFRDKNSMSLSHSAGTSFKDESFGHSYDKDSLSPGKTTSSEMIRNVESLVRDQKDEDDQIDQSDMPAPIPKDRTLALESKIKKNVSAALKDKPSHKILIRQDEITRFSHVVQRQDVIKEEISTSSDKTASQTIKPKASSVIFKEESPERSYQEIEYKRLSDAHGDTDCPDHRYEYDSSSSNPTLAAIEPIIEDDSSSSSNDQTVQ